MTAVWLAEPAVSMIADRLTIEQDVIFGGIPSWDSLTVAVYSDGSIRFEGRNDRAPEIPGHWLPIVTDFLLRVMPMTEVSAL